MDDRSRVWQPAIIHRVASLLPRNEVALTLRLVNQAFCKELEERCEVSLEEPLPIGASAAFAATWSSPAACRGLTITQRRKLLHKTAAAGEVAMLEVAAEATGLALDHGVLQAAVEAGKLTVCRWLCEPGRQPPDIHLHLRAMAAAAEGGHTAVCEWALLKLKPPRSLDGSAAATVLWFASAVQLAARGGHAETAEWLLARSGENPFITPSIMLQAAAKGYDLPAFQQLSARLGGLQALGGWSRDGVVAAAVTSPGPDWKAKAEWCMKQGCELGPAAAGRAFRMAGLRLKDEAVVERFVWLAEQGRGFTGGEAEAEVLTTAIKRGNSAAVRYLLGLGIRCAASDVDWDDCDRLHLDVLRALQGAGCDVGAPGKLAERACREGQLRIVEWLLEAYGAEAVDLQACILNAVGSGDVRLVRWLAEHQQPKSGGLGPRSTSGAAPAAALGWDRQQLHELWWNAAASGSEEMLELLLEWGCPLPAAEPGETSNVWPVAALNDDLRTLGVLRRLGGGAGMPWGSDGTFAACVWHEGTRKGASLGTLQWLLAEGCPVDWGRAESAARERLRRAYRYDGEPKAVLKWVKKQRSRTESLGGLRRSMRSARDWALGRIHAARGVLAALGR